MTHCRQARNFHRHMALRHLSLSQKQNQVLHRPQLRKPAALAHPRLLLQAATTATRNFTLCGCQPIALAFGLDEGPLLGGHLLRICQTGGTPRGFAVFEKPMSGQKPGTFGGQEEVQRSRS